MLDIIYANLAQQFKEIPEPVCGFTLNDRRHKAVSQGRAAYGREEPYGHIAESGRSPGVTEA